LRRHGTLTKVLGAALLIIWAVAAVSPYDRSDWLLENMLVFVTVPVIARYGPDLRLSDTSYVCLFIFFALHLVGAHYTYAQVPLDIWGVGRNHYDRFVHLAYGLLLARPTLELFAARMKSQGIWMWLMPVLFLVSHGAVYEVIEWIAAELFGGDLGVAFLGTQGDEWDAQKDVALASVGAALGVSGWLLWDRRTARR
jgi:putative membrane protein